MGRALDLVDAGLDAERREADDAVGRHRVGRIVRVDVRHALVVDRQGARLADAEVGVRVERVGRARAGEGERVRAGRLARERKARAGHGDRLAEGDDDARTAGDVDRAVRGSRARDGRRVVTRRRRRVRSEPVERVRGEAVPLGGRVEGVGAVRIAGLDARLAAERVVGGAREARAPLRARVDADLADHVEDRRALAQDDGVVAVEPARAVRLVGLREDRVAARSPARRRTRRRSATVPVRLIVSPAVAEPLKYIWTL